LSIFEQTNFVDDNKIIKQFNHPTDLEAIKEATNILHYSGTDPAEKKKIEIEQEAWRSVNAMFENERNELLKSLTEKDQALTEKDQVITEKDQALIQMQKELDALRQKLGEK
jgi:septal ring factor EnvC (AmiA/AmiB activator)